MALCVRACSLLSITSGSVARFRGPAEPQPREKRESLGPRGPEQEEMLARCRAVRERRLEDLGPECPGRRDLLAREPRSYTGHASKHGFGDRIAL